MAKLVHLILSVVYFVFAFKIVAFLFKKNVSADVLVYVGIGLFALFFVADFIINGKVLRSVKNLKQESKLAYQFFLFFAIPPMGVVASACGIKSLLESGSYSVFIGAVTFTALFSTLCFTATSSMRNGASKKNYFDCGKRFFESTLNFFYVILLKFLLDSLSVHMQKAPSCRIHPLELGVQAFLLFVGVLFLIVGISTFLIALHKLQKEMITYPKDEPKP